jgi:hypothetical protein
VTITTTVVVRLSPSRLQRRSANAAIMIVGSAVMANDTAVVDSLLTPASEP